MVEHGCRIDWTRGDFYPVGGDCSAGAEGVLSLSIGMVMFARHRKVLQGS